MELKTRNLFEFGPFRLDPSERRLTCDSQQVALSPKSFELLVYLVANHGRLVTKDQIMRAVWPASFVEEANLTVSKSALRKVPGKNDGGLQYIDTVPKTGYRFTAAVTEVISSREDNSPGATNLPRFEARSMTVSVPLAEPDDTKRASGPLLVKSKTVRRPAWRNSILIPALAGLACVVILVTGYLIYLNTSRLTSSPPVQRSLGILPLRNLRHEPDNDFLGFSLADAVITKLGAVSSMTVRPSSAIEKYKGQTIDLKQTAADLNVDTLLTGNFIRDGEDLRITYQLIDAKTERILARDTIDLKYDKLLTVQDNVAQQIIKGLELNLSPPKRFASSPMSPSILWLTNTI